MEKIIPLLVIIELILQLFGFFQIVKCVRDPSGFHSDKLHKALEEGDTKTAARIILGKNKVNQF